MSDQETPRTLIESYLRTINTQQPFYQTKRRKPITRTPVGDGGSGKQPKTKSRTSLNSSLITPRTRIESLTAAKKTEAPITRNKKRRSEAADANIRPVKKRSLRSGFAPLANSTFDNQTPRTNIEEFLREASEQTPFLNPKRTFEVPKSPWRKPNDLSTEVLTGNVPHTRLSQIKKQEQKSIASPVKKDTISVTDSPLTPLKTPEIPVDKTLNFSPIFGVPTPHQERGLKGRRNRQPSIWEFTKKSELSATGTKSRSHVTKNDQASRDEDDVSPKKDKTNKELDVQNMDEVVPPSEYSDNASFDVESDKQDIESNTSGKSPYRSSHQQTSPTRRSSRISNQFPELQHSVLKVQEERMSPTVKSQVENLPESSEKAIQKEETSLAQQSQYKSHQTEQASLSQRSVRRSLQPERTRLSENTLRRSLPSAKASIAEESVQIDSLLHSPASSRSLRAEKRKSLTSVSQSSLAQKSPSRSVQASVSQSLVSSSRSLREENRKSLASVSQSSLSQKSPSRSVQTSVSQSLASSSRSLREEKRKSLASVSQSSLSQKSPNRSVQTERASLTRKSVGSFLPDRTSLSQKSPRQSLQAERMTFSEQSASRSPQTDSDTISRNKSSTSLMRKNKSLKENSAQQSSGTHTVEERLQEKPKPTRRRTPVNPNTLPPATVKQAFTHFCNMRVTKDAINEVVNVSEYFFNNISRDLEAYARHAGRKVIDETDCELLMKRHKFITEKQSLYSLAEKYLPLELRQEIIPIARSGNRIEGL